MPNRMFFLPHIRAWKIRLIYTIPPGGDTAHTDQSAMKR